MYVSSQFNRVYYVSTPNGTIDCEHVPTMCASLAPAGAWQPISWSSKAQQLEAEQYYSSLGVTRWVSQEVQWWPYLPTVLSLPLFTWLHVSGGCDCLAAICVNLDILITGMPATAKHGQ